MSKKFDPYPNKIIPKEDVIRFANWPMEEIVIYKYLELHNEKVEILISYAKCLGKVFNLINNYCPEITDNEPKILQELLNIYKELEKEMKENNK